MRRAPRPSDLHFTRVWRDISGILRVSGDGLDVPYIDRWTACKGLTEIWRAILSKIGD